MHTPAHFFPLIFLLLLAPLVLLADLLLLRRGEVVLDVEGLPDLLRGLPLDHVGHGLAGHIKETLDIKVIGGQDELEESALETNWFGVLGPEHVLG